MSAAAERWGIWAIPASTWRGRYYASTEGWVYAPNGKEDWTFTSEEDAASAVSVVVRMPASWVRPNRDARRTKAAFRRLKDPEIHARMRGTEH